MLFTDMVASTQHAAATGDERWRAVLHRFVEITAELTQRFGGTVVKSTGDDHLATLDGPTQAIRCAEALRADTVGAADRATVLATAALAVSQVDRVLRTIRGGERAPDPGPPPTLDTTLEFDVGASSIVAR